MNVSLNGEPVSSEAPTLLLFLQERGVDTDQRGIAVAINDEVIARAAWEGCTIADGDDIEVITAMQGG
jgi:sulfur carrier protein